MWRLNSPGVVDVGLGHTSCLLVSDYVGLVWVNWAKSQLGIYHLEICPLNSRLLLRLKPKRKPNSSNSPNLYDFQRSSETQEVAEHLRSHLLTGSSMFHRVSLTLTRNVGGQSPWLIPFNTKQHPDMRCNQILLPRVRQNITSKRACVTMEWRCDGSFRVSLLSGLRITNPVT